MEKLKIHLWFVAMNLIFTRLSTRPISTLHGVTSLVKSAVATLVILLDGSVKGGQRALKCCVVMMNWGRAVRITGEAKPADCLLSKINSRPCLYT